MDRYSLQTHAWLNDMYSIRDRWVPAYFRDIHLCCLMKTTSRCESSNSSFKVNTSSANTLVQFMLCFETRMDSQRYRQRVSEYKSFSAIFIPSTNLSIEKQAFEFYTLTLFNEVQKEISKGYSFCYISTTEDVDGISNYYVRHYDRRNDLTNTFTVTHVSST
jgi:hypothetical protein